VFLQGRTDFVVLLYEKAWWADLGWLTGSQPAALSLSSSAEQRGR